MRTGIFKTAQYAGEEHTKAQLKEELELKIQEIQMNKIIQGQEMKREDLQELSNIGAVIESFGIPAIGEYKNYGFEIDENYKVTIGSKLQGAKPEGTVKVLESETIITQIKVAASIAEGSISSIEATNGAVLKTDTSETEKIFEVTEGGTYYFKITSSTGRVAIVSATVVAKEPITEITLNKTSTSILVGNTETLTATITPENATYKNIEWTSSDENIATVENGKITVKAAGTATITATAQDGSGKSATCKVTVTPKVVAGTTHTAKALTYTWEEINKIAKAISDKDNIITNTTAEATVTIDKTYTVGVGDTLTVTQNGVEKTVRIIGFNHDTLTNKSVYGGTNTYAGISFDFVSVLMDAGINNSQTGQGGWGACDLRSTLNNTTINSLSNATYIKQVNKSYMYYNASSVAISSDKLWLLACSEIWNAGNGYQGRYGWCATKEGEQYKYFTNFNNIAYNVANVNLDKGTNNSGWWLRSPVTNGHHYSFCKLSGDGKGVTDNAATKLGIAPGFCI